MSVCLRARRGVFRSAASLVGVLSAALPVPARDPAPDVVLVYRELTNREELKIKTAGAESVRPAGDMHFDWLPVARPTFGLDRSPRTFCVEPLVPTYQGTVYP